MNNNKMRVEIKKMWLDALRSGEYKQGQLALRTDDKFCCLGVLCDLHHKNSDAELNWEYCGDNSRRMYCPKTYAGDDAFLPKIVMDWAGLAYYECSESIILSKLANCNDSGSDFLEIANIIEAEL